MRAKFFKLLAETGNVAGTCRVVNISRRHAYDLKHEDKVFGESWADAIEDYIDSLESEADRRAKEGVCRGVYYKGERIDTVHDYSDTLMIVRLKALRPDMYRERSDVKMSGDVTVMRKMYSDSPADN